MKLFVVDRGLQQQLPQGKDDRKGLEALQYTLYYAIAKKRWAQNTAMSLKFQVTSVRSGIEGYRQRLSEYMEHFTGNITDRISVFLYDLRKKLKHWARSSETISIQLWQQVLKLLVASFVILIVSIVVQDLFDSKMWIVSNGKCANSASSPVSIQHPRREVLCYVLATIER